MEKINWSLISASGSPPQNCPSSPGGSSRGMAKRGSVRCRHGHPSVQLRSRKASGADEPCLHWCKEGTGSRVIRKEGQKEILKYHLGFFGKENQDRASRALASQEAECQGHWLSSDFMRFGYQWKLRASNHSIFFFPVCYTGETLRYSQKWLV